MNKKVAVIAGLIIVGLLGVFALTNKKESTALDLSGKESITVTHELGETQVAIKPERVVVFDYAALDTLDALGVESIVGVANSNLPEGLKKYEGKEYKNVGTIKEPDLEAVKSTNPDLIIIGGRLADYYDQLNQIAPTILVSKDNTDYVGSVFKNINTLGKIFKLEDVTKEKITEIEKEIAEVKKKVQEKGAEALTVMVNEGNLSVYNDKSRFALLYQGFGFKNVDETIKNSDHGQTVTFEYLTQTNPEYLFVLDRGAATGAKSTAENVLNNDIVKSTDAYKNNKIVYLDPVTWYTNDGGLNSIHIMINNVKDILE